MKIYRVSPDPSSCVILTMDNLLQQGFCGTPGMHVYCNSSCKCQFPFPYNLLCMQLCTL